ncbi:MAG: hypothetical protein MUC53_01900 [Candidatus Contendobacter sp.]|jgi:hypothetical protein|nr:hypothetical protein [Candidatus Contendobacter sp.]
MSTLTERILPRISAYAQILLVFLVSRLMLMLIGILTFDNFGDLTGHPFVWENLLHLYARWDSGWYLTIIENGYSPVESIHQAGATNYAFFPLYPLLSAMIQQTLDIPAITAGVLVSNLALIAALLLIFEYVRILGLSRQVGVMTVLLVCFVPQSFIFSAVYTESVFLLSLTAAMYALRQQHYLTAGLCAALLSATRANGIFFIVFAGVWLLRQQGLRPLRYPWRYPEQLLPIALAPLGLVTFWWFCFLTTGDAFAQASSALHGWGWQTDLPWRNLVIHLTSESLSTRFWAISSLLVCTFSFTLLQLRLYEEFLLCFSIMLLYWSGVLPHSLLRYSIVLFPIFIGVASALEHRRFLFWLLLGLCSLLNGFLMTAWTSTRWISI